MNLKELPYETIEAILDALPVDVSFVDAEDTVKYFNTPKRGRVFPRSKLDLQRKVQNCHPPQSLDKVNKILDGFRAGTMEDAPFWLTVGGRFLKIDYFPVRDENGKFLGTIEILQDATEVRSLQGEKKLL